MTLPAPPRCWWTQRNLWWPATHQLVRSFAKRVRTSFERTNLKYMRLFHEYFEIGHAARDQSLSTRTRIDAALSWTHYRLLPRVHDSLARRRYHDEALAAGWSTRELDRQITTRFVERGLAAASPSIEQRQDLSDPALALRDPYVLEFIGLPDRFVDTEADLEQALIDQLQAFRPPGQGALPRLDPRHRRP